MLRVFIKYVTANVLGMIGLSCYILADTFFVAQGTGLDGLAALNIAIPIYSLIQGLGLMIGMGGATRFSLSKHQGDGPDHRLLFSRCLCLVFLCCLPLVIIGLFGSEKLAWLLGARNHILPMSSTYLGILLIFSPLFLLNNLVICFVRNDHAPKLSMTAMLTGSLSNIILDYLFIFPLGMGIFGAALATGIAPLVSLFVLSIHFIKKRNGFSFSIKLFSLSGAGKLLAPGISSLITELSSGVVMIIFNTILLRIVGNLGVAAYGIIANLTLVITAILTGIAQGMQPILSKCYGSGEHSKVKQLYGYGIKTALIFSLAVYLLSFVFAAPITDLFNQEQNQQLASMGVPGIRISFTAFFFMGFNIIPAAFYSSTDQSSKAFIISISRGALVIIPTAFLLSFLLQVTGVWLALPVTEFLVALGGLWLIRHKKSTKIR